MFNPQWQPLEGNYLTFYIIEKPVIFITFPLDIQTWIPSTVFLGEFVHIDIFNPHISVAKCSRGMTQLRSPSGWSAGLVLLPNFSMGGSRCLVARDLLGPNFSQFKLETKYNRYHFRSHPRWLAILFWKLIKKNFLTIIWMPRSSHKLYEQ